MTSIVKANEDNRLNIGRNLSDFYTEGDAIDSFCELVCYICDIDTKPPVTYETRFPSIFSEKGVLNYANVYNTGAFSDPNVKPGTVVGFGDGKETTSRYVVAIVLPRADRPSDLQLLRGLRRPFKLGGVRQPEKSDGLQESDGLRPGKSGDVRDDERFSAFQRGLDQLVDCISAIRKQRGQKIETVSFCGLDDPCFEGIRSNPNLKPVLDAFSNASECIYTFTSGLSSQE